ncbi:transmembrane protein 134 isoform X1 [Danaus plexippus]|uniref:transmembrane protein 134 isoform X1 n=1 Tax=Danaus plexippus TaxID=13037 RepID=UPI002AAF8E05|nr:transmembrane protein 134 isoform X1 [Danaus plexippus]
MTRPFGNSDKRFSIDDAFEEETDEAIKVYGATGDRSPLQNKFKNGGDYLSSCCNKTKQIIKCHNEARTVDPDKSITKTYKCTEDTTSRDSDSLIHEYVEATQSLYCWNHPKVRENWKTVCAAVILLVVGVGLLGMGTFAVAEPENGLQGAVFFVAGMICFVPGAYHVVYIWLAARGQRGYDFYHLPLFT